MILPTGTDHDQKNTFIDFGVKRSKLKVKFGLQTFYCFLTIIDLFLFGIQRWYLTHVLTMTRGLRDLVMKLSKVKLKFRVWSSIVSATKLYHFWPTIMILHRCISYDPRWAPIGFGVNRSMPNLESLNVLPRWGVGWVILPFRAGQGTFFRVMLKS